MQQAPSYKHVMADSSKLLRHSETIKMASSPLRRKSVLLLLLMKFQMYAQLIHMWYYT